MGYRRLTLKDRYQIEAYLESDLGVREIAEKLGVCASSISRELRRRKGEYSADKAQDLALKARSRRYLKCLKIKGRLERNVRRKLKKEWSPEQIAGRLKLDGGQAVSQQTIYRYIARKKLNGDPLWKQLRILRKQRKDRTKISWKPHPEPLKERVFVKDRPKIVEKRKRLGDVERDTVFGKANGPLLLTIVDRKSRLVRLEWLPKKSSHLIHKATVRALKGQAVKTITNDNGTEFAQHHLTAKTLNTKIYFSHSYRAWERGTNENLNGLLRQYFPRKKNIGYLSRRELKKIEHRLNSRPRKCLGYKTPLEIHSGKSGQVLR